MMFGARLSQERALVTVSGEMNHASGSQPVYLWQ